MKINTLIKHRINTKQELELVDREYGVELDIRTKDELYILHHDPFVKGENFRDYLRAYQHNIIILNTKTDGLEAGLIKLMEEYNISKYFFLDTTIPSIIKTVQNGCSKIAVRYSEYEPISFIEKFAGKVDWVWVDCFTKNILTQEAYLFLKKHFKICIVSPELQGHPLTWIDDFKITYKGFEIDAVCTKRPDLWL